MKALVIIPTYNERETLPVVVDAVLDHAGFHVLVVDDASPDRTADVVREMSSAGERVFLLERPGKLGLGTAYVEGFKWGLERGYDYFIEMDADNSHDPAALPFFVAEIDKGNGLAVGSRYLEGTISVVGWDFRRLLLSKFGNFYASRILGLQLTDMTSGFRCYARKALEALDLDDIRSNGYAFQIEMVFRVLASGNKVSEVPIIFRERASGASKMSKKIIREAVVLPWRLRFGAVVVTGATGRFSTIDYKIRSVIGLLLIALSIIGGARLGWWLITEGDIIEAIHQFKMALPDWAWTAMKISLSAASAIIFLAFFAAAAIVVLQGRRQRT